MFTLPLLFYRLEATCGGRRDFTNIKMATAGILKRNLEKMCKRAEKVKKKNQYFGKFLSEIPDWSSLHFTFCTQSQFLELVNDKAKLD